MMPSDASKKSEDTPTTSVPLLPKRTQLDKLRPVIVLFTCALSVCLQMLGRWYRQCYPAHGWAYLNIQLLFTGMAFSLPSSINKRLSKPIASPESFLLFCPLSVVLAHVLMDLDWPMRNGFGECGFVPFAQSSST